MLPWPAVISMPSSTVLTSPLPIAIQRLITEINEENPDIHGAFQLRPSTDPITSHWSQS
jgi:hypothetical protein